MGYNMCALIFSAAFVGNISHFKKNSTRYYHKCTQVVMQSTRYSSQILIKHEFSEKVFKKIVKYKVS